MPRLHTVAASTRKPPVKSAGRVLAELDAADIRDFVVRLNIQMDDQGCPLASMRYALAALLKIGGDQ